MTAEKAREHFSALYEGTLEQGLRSVLERKLSMDASLQAEYKAFQRTMQMLDQMKDEPVEIPIYLSDRIATRIEQAQGPRRGTLLSGWIGRLALGAAATLVLAATARTILVNNSAPVAQAGLIGVSAVVSPTVESTSSRNQAMVRYFDARPAVCTVKDAEGTLSRYQTTPNTPFSVKLDNPNQEASIFEVQFRADSGIIIAVPGQKLQVSSTGTGTLKNFALAIADRYGIPVVLSRVDDSRTVNWNLSGTDAHADATRAVSGENLTVTLTSKDTLLISDR